MSEETIDKWNNASNYLSKKQYDSALSILNELAMQGEKFAYAEMGNIFLIEDQGKSRDPDRALECFNKGYELGDIEAGLGVARIYYLGLGREEDFEKSFRLYEEISRHGNPVGDVMMGRMFRLGQFVPQSFEKAQVCYEEAARKGSAIGLRNLGILEVKRGRYLSGWIRIGLAIMKGIIIGFRDPTDPRVCEN